jgi:hypothetical protein
MKKILILEDTNENTDTAKKFFESIDQQEFTFMYVETVTEAIKHLHDTYFLIADRGVPIISNETMADYKKTSYQHVKYLQEDNGYMIAAIAKSMNIPFVIFTEHGKASIIIAEKEKEKKLVTIGQILKVLDLHSQTARDVLSWIIEEQYFKRADLGTWFQRKSDIVTWENLWRKLIETNFLKDI